VAEAIALAVVDKRAVGQTYNIGAEEAPTLAERARQIGELAGWKGTILALPSERVPAHLRTPYEPHQDLVMDTRRLRTELGFTETVSKEEGIRRTIDWEATIPAEPSDPGTAEYAAEDAALATMGSSV
jgi:nucleoside-diphosphate-sugar epimerase